MFPIPIYNGCLIYKLKNIKARLKKVKIMEDLNEKK